MSSSSFEELMEADHEPTIEELIERLGEKPSMMTWRDLELYTQNKINWRLYTTNLIGEGEFHKNDRPYTVAQLIQAAVSLDKKAIYLYEKLQDLEEEVRRMSI
jgi:hypothetical protein